MSIAEDDFMFAAEPASNDLRGQVFGHVTLTDDAYLQVTEVVVIEDGVPHREEYHYFLVIEGVEIFGFERDPTHDPPVHSHGREHAGSECEPITFNGAMEMAWRAITYHAELGLDDLDPAEPGDPWPRYRR